jgi:sortase A
MRKVKSPEDLTVEELRQLLIDKQRRRRQEHLERFRRTGRVVSLASDIAPTTLDHLVTTRSDTFSDTAAPLSWREKNKPWLDRLLLGVEVLAVLALVFVLFNGLEIIRDLNAQVAEVLVQPTLTPTPLISAVVLPSGHTPPNSPGGAKYNEAEIPEHLRPLVQSLLEVTLPTPGPEQAIRIQIPAIEVDAPIVQGDGWEQLKKGVAQHIGSADPGQNGNLVLTAHNDVFGEIFRYLDQLKRGDQIVIYTNQRSYTYTITSSQIVGPYEVEVMAPTENATITLISCYPYLVDNKRIIVNGVLQTRK